MVLAGVLLLTFLSSSDASYKDCDHCNKDGPWWPLFKPSQIISSEFPEHGGHVQYRSHERRSYELSSASQEQGIVEDGVPHLVSSGNLGSRPSAGVDSPVRTFNSGSKPQLQWDHYGDIGQKSVVSFTSGEALNGRSRESVISGEQKSVEHLKENEKTIDGAVKENLKPQPKTDLISEEEESTSKSQEGSFFNEGSFFEDKHPVASVENQFLGSFEVSRDSLPFSEEIKDTINSVEVPSSNWYRGGARHRGSVATSYSSMTTMFDSPVTPRIKDLLHPELSFNDISMYVKRQHAPVSRSHFFDGRNTTKQFLVHKPFYEGKGALHVQKAPPLAPWPLPKHPHPHSSTALHWQEAPAHSPLRRIIHHESRINHIIPTKNPFADIGWSDSKRVEHHARPPLVGKTLYFLRKKPNSFDTKKVGRRRSQNYVYFVKNNNRLR